MESVDVYLLLMILPILTRKNVIVIIIWAIAHYF